MRKFRLWLCENVIRSAMQCMPGPAFGSTFVYWPKNADGTGVKGFVCSNMIPPERQDAMASVVLMGQEIEDLSALVSFMMTNILHEKYKPAETRH